MNKYNMIPEDKLTKLLNSPNREDNIIACQSILRTNCGHQHLMVKLQEKIDGIYYVYITREHLIYLSDIDSKITRHIIDLKDIQP